MESDAGKAGLNADERKEQRLKISYPTIRLFETWIKEVYLKILPNSKMGYSGKYVTLQHGNFMVSYCHLSQISVSQGQDVLSGDVVGITGNTGRCTGGICISHVNTKDIVSIQALLSTRLSVSINCTLLY